MSIRAYTTPAGWALTLLGLGLMIFAFLAAFSIIGFASFLAGAIAVLPGIFLLRVGPAQTLPEALLESVIILILLVVLSALAWWGLASAIQSV